MRTSELQVHWRQRACTCPEPVDLPLDGEIVELYIALSAVNFDFTGNQTEDLSDWLEHDVQANNYPIAAVVGSGEDFASRTRAMLDRPYLSHIDACTCCREAVAMN